MGCKEVEEQHSEEFHKEVEEPACTCEGQEDGVEIHEEELQMRRLKWMGRRLKRQPAWMSTRSRCGRRRARRRRPRRQPTWRRWNKTHRSKIKF